MSGRDAVAVPRIPLPKPTRETAPFYEAARRGELRFQRCTGCGRFRHYPRPICPRCFSRDLEWACSTGRGTVYTWTIVRGPTLPAFEAKLPYNVVDVLLDEGVHFVSEVLDCSPEEIRAGMPVVAVFVPVSEEITLVKFRRARRGEMADEEKARPAEDAYEYLWSCPNCGKRLERRQCKARCPRCGFFVDCSDTGV